MSKEITEEKSLIIPNEVIVIGKLRDKDDKSVIDTELPIKEQVDAMFKKFKFIRDTEPNKAAQDAGFLSGKFFAINMGDPGGETVVLPNGRKVRKSRSTTDAGDTVVFASNRISVYEEIKEELLARRVEIVGNDPNAGKLRLHEYGLFGFMDIFPLGFRHKVWTRDEKGALVPFYSNVKQDDGSYKKEQAIRNTGRHFVYEDDYKNLEVLRDNIRKQVERWKIIEVGDNTTPEAGVKVTEEKPTTPPKAEEKDDL